MNNRRRATMRTMYRYDYSRRWTVEAGFNLAQVIKYMKRPEQTNLIKWHKSNKRW